MEKKQEMEWEAAQSTEINVDLVSAAKRHLEFLAAVDRNRSLYEGPALDRAIYRYNAHWLPLLAKHSESPLFEGPLVAPLDCEWIWHCHRLNPVRYKKDCEEFYGRILENKNVISSFKGISTKPTEDMWETLFPGEPYELNLEHVREVNMSAKGEVGENCTKYDLISAVQRQRPFFYQVSRLHLNDTRYIEGAVARYKGFLHLIKRNKERGIKGCCVPTYDIDLIWHTHQLHPVSYGEDLVKIMGNILEHDDTDSDRTKGQKLDVGFTGTIKAFENIYGRRYMRAGALFRGSPPAPVRLTPYSGTITKKVPSVNESTKVAPPAMKVFEVMLEFVGVRNLPEGHSGSLFVSFSKSQPDKIFNAKRTLSILSESSEKQVASFQCQPTGHLLFELVSTVLPPTESSKTMGTTSICLEDFLSPDSDLTVEKWLDLVPSSEIMEAKPIGLRVAISVTVPTPTPYTLHMVSSQSFSKSSCASPPQPARVQFSKNWTSVVNEDGNKVLNLQMRDLQKSKGKKICRRKVVLGLMDSGKICPLAEFAGFKWSMANSPWTLKFPNTNNDDGHLLEMNGPHTVRLFPGGRLDYESNRCDKHKAECEHEPHLITAVKFSAEEPYGTAVALLDMKSGIVKVKEEWFVLPGLVVTLILGNILRKTLGSKKISNEVHNPAVGSQPKKVDVSKENGLVSANGGACATALESRGCENMGKSGVSGGSCWGNGGSCWGSDVSGGGWGSANGGSCWGNSVSSGTCWGSANGGSCWGNGVTSGTCWGSANGGSCWGNGVTSGTCWGSANGGSCWGNGVSSGTCWGSANGGSCWGNGVSGGTCWGSANGGSCWGNGVTSGTCWGSANGGSCWGNGVSGGTCWGSANGGSCWGNGVSGGSCWGSVNGGSCWGNGISGGSCWGSTNGGSCWGNGISGGSCWGSTNGGSCWGSGGSITNHGVKGAGCWGSGGMSNGGIKGQPNQEIAVA